MLPSSMPRRVSSLSGVGQGAPGPGGIGQRDIAQHRLTGGQLLAAIHLLFNAQNAVGSLHSS